MTNFISVYFFIFFIITLFLYFLFPIKYRWFLLLTSSIFFYSSAGVDSLIFLGLAAITAYAIARNIEDVYSEQKNNKKTAKMLLV